MLEQAQQALLRSRRHPKLKDASFFRQNKEAALTPQSQQSSTYIRCLLETRQQAITEDDDRCWTTPLPWSTFQPWPPARPTAEAAGDAGVQALAPNSSNPTLILTGWVSLGQLLSLPELPFLFFFLTTPCSMWDPSSLTRDHTCTSCSENEES